MRAPTTLAALALLLAPLATGCRDSAEKRRAAAERAAAEAHAEAERAAAERKAAEEQAARERAPGEKKAAVQQPEAPKGGEKQDREGQVRPRAMLVEAKQPGVWVMAFSPDGKALATGNYDGTVTLWDVEKARVRFRLVVQPPPEE